MTTSSKLKIVGVAGLPRSGKDTVAEFLMNSGYYGVSLGDIVRDEARKRHADKPDPISVKNMTETSNHLRTEQGADFALNEALIRYRKAQKTANYKGLVVFSVRAPVEVDFILQNGGQLFWVEASDEVRHKRANANKRKGETDVSMDEMKQQEALQEQPQPGIPAEVQMNTSYVKSKATKVIENNGDNLESFETKVRKEIDQLK